MSDLEIRRMTADDEPALAAFLNRVYHPFGQFKYPERWRWQFLDNPFRRDGEISLWIAVSHGRIVGQAANVAVPIKVGSATVPGFAQCDLAVLPEYRRAGVAGDLVTAMLAEVELAIVLWAAPITQRIMGQLGYVQLPTIPWLCYEPPTLEPGPARPEATDVRNGSRDIQITRVDRFGPEADALWERIGPEFGIATVRSSAYLNWKFTAQPHMAYDLLEARQGGTLQGIAVVRTSRPPEPPMVVLGDLLVSRHDRATATALCDFVRTAHGRPGTPIVAATSVAEYREALCKIGFVEQKRPRPVSPFVWSRRPRPELPRLAETMLMSRTDSDWDQYPYAGVA
jgi:GNAT superfamily N-acetyltransferase